MKASIIILDFEKSKRVLQNVESIQKQKTDFPFEIIIAVNAATDEAKTKLKPLEKIDNVKLVFNEKNLGYTRGMNAAAAEAAGEFLLVVNPDIVWKAENTLQKLVDFMEKNENVGIASPQQIDEGSGGIALTVRAFPKLHRQIARRSWLRYLPGIRKGVAYDEMQHLNYAKTQSVDWLQSSFWILRKKTWDKLGGLDERFFLFMSDPDFCYRMWEAGLEVVYYPEVKVYADGLRCSAGGFTDFFTKWTLRQHLRDAMKYQAKYLLKKKVR